MNTDGPSMPKSIRDQPKRGPCDIMWHPQGHGYYICPRQVREFNREIKDDNADLLRQPVHTHAYFTDFANRRGEPLHGDDISDLLRSYRRMFDGTGWD